MVLGMNSNINEPKELLDHVRRLWEMNSYDEDDEHSKWVAARLCREDQEKNGRNWDKCLNCGFPFMVGLFGADGHFCSDSCREKTTAYMADAYVPPDDDRDYSDNALVTTVYDGDRRLEDYD